MFKKIFMIPFLSLILVSAVAVVYSQVIHGTEAQKKQFTGLDALDIAKKLGVREREVSIQSPDCTEWGMLQKGVVAANVNDVSARDEIVCDFGSLGIWIFDGAYDSGTWNQLTGVDPTFIMAIQWGGISEDRIIANFSSYGLWAWSYAGYPGTWEQLSGVSCTSAIAVDDDMDGNKELHADFDSLGLWRYDNDTHTWTHLTGDNPSNYSVQMDLWNAGWEEGAHGFGSKGLWLAKWQSGAPYFVQLSDRKPGDDHASLDFSGDASEELVADIGPDGIWACLETTSAPYFEWHQISPYQPNGMKPWWSSDGTHYDLLLDFFYETGGPDGLWWWDGNHTSPLLTKIHDTTPGGGYYEPFDPNGSLTEPNGDEEVAVDLEANGLWMYDHNGATQWTQLSACNPVYMVRADINGSGIDEGLIVNFGSLGLWLYDGYTEGWHILTGVGPDWSLLPIVPGEWTATTDFGWIDFWVNFEGTYVTKIKFNFTGWMGRSGSITVSRTPGWEISDRQFEISRDLNPDPFIIEMWTVKGTFSYCSDQASDQATGTWDVVIYGTPYSGTWTGSPK